MIDPRTSISRFDQFSRANDNFMRDVTVYCRPHPVEQILVIPEVEERLHVFQEHEELA